MHSSIVQYEQLTTTYQYISGKLDKCDIRQVCITVICKSTYPENYILMVMPPPNHISPPSMAATFLATCLMAVLQPSGYSVFHDGDTPIQLSLP